jgi:phage gp29-like protein
MGRLRDLRNALLQRASLALTSWSSPEPGAKWLVKPRPGQWHSGARDDYSVDNTARKATAEKLGRALKNADQGDTDQQFEIFEEAERDPVVGQTYFKRRLSVVGKELQIVPAIPGNRAAEKAAEVATAMILGDDGSGGIQNLEEGLFNLSDAIGKAFSVSQIVWALRGGKFIPERLEHWPQREFVLGDLSQAHDMDADELRVITDEQAAFGRPLTDFPPATWIVHRQKAFSQPLARAALFRSVVWYWLFKRFGTSDWSIYLERFGVPPRLAKYGPSTTKEQRAEMWQSVLNMGKDHAAIMPDSGTIELLETKGLSAGAPHPAFIAYCNEQLTIAISGNTMSTTQGDRGARSAKEAYQWDEDQQTRFDCGLLAKTVRDQLVTPVVRFNVGPSVPIPLVRFQIEDTEDLNERAKRDEILHGMGKAIPVSYVEQTYSVPEPDEGEPILPPKAKPAAAAGGNGRPPEPPGDAPEDQPDEGGEEDEGGQQAAAGGAPGGDFRALVVAARFALREAGLAEKKSSVDWLISQMLSDEQ